MLKISRCWKFLHNALHSRLKFYFIFYKITKLHFVKLQKSSLSTFGARLWNSIHSSLKKLNNNNFENEICKILIKVLVKEDQYFDSNFRSIVREISKL